MHTRYAILIFLTGASFMDIRTRNVPNWYILINGIYFLALKVLEDWNTQWGMRELDTKEVLNWILLWFFVHLIKWTIAFLAGLLLFQIKALGGADIKILIIMAIMMGWKNYLFMFLISMVLFLLGSFIRIVYKVGIKKDYRNYLMQPQQVLIMLRRRQYGLHSNYHRMAYIWAICISYFMIMIEGMC